MEWERKFTELIRDTEANIVKIKKRLAVSKQSSVSLAQTAAESSPVKNNLEMTTYESSSPAAHDCHTCTQECYLSHCNKSNSAMQRLRNMAQPGLPKRDRGWPLVLARKAPAPEHRRMSFLNRREIISQCNQSLLEKHQKDEKKITEVSAADIHRLFEDENKTPSSPESRMESLIDELLLLRKEKGEQHRQIQRLMKDQQHMQVRLDELEKTVGKYSQHCSCRQRDPFPTVTAAEVTNDELVHKLEGLQAKVVELEAKLNASNLPALIGVELDNELGPIMDDHYASVSSRQEQPETQKDVSSLVKDITDGDLDDWDTTDELSLEELTLSSTDDDSGSLID